MPAKHPARWGPGAILLSLPGGVIPLDEAAGYIRLELSAAKDTLALRQVMVRRVAESKIVYSAIGR